MNRFKIQYKNNFMDRQSFSDSIRLTYPFINYLRVYDNGVEIDKSTWSKRGDVTFEYDSFGRIIKSISIFGLRCQYEYDDSDRVVSYSNSDGNCIKIKYDGEIMSIESKGKFYSYCMDEFGTMTPL